MRTVCEQTVSSRAQEWWPGGPYGSPRYQACQQRIQLGSPTHLRTRVQRYAILASAHAQQGDLEGACAVGRLVLAEVPRLRSTRTLDDVARLVQLVGAKSGQATQDFTKQAREVLKSR
jgi:hypothetical protein